MAINPMITHGETFGRIVPTETVVLGPHNGNSESSPSGIDPAYPAGRRQFQISRRSGSAYQALSVGTDK